MSYISKSEYEYYKSQVEHYKEHCENIYVPCAICGKASVTYVNSIMGGFKWYVCEDHKHASSYFGCGRMGIMMNDEFVDMKYLDEQVEIIRKIF